MPMIYQCCENQKLIKNGTRNGYQNYKCKSCGKQMNDSSNPPYRPSFADKPMSNKDRQSLFNFKKEKKMNITPEKLNQLKRLQTVSNFNEYLPDSLSLFLKLYGEESIDFIVSRIEQVKQRKINSLNRLLTSNKITYFRAYCRKFKVKGYSKMNFDELKQALTAEIEKQINFIQSI